MISAKLGDLPKVTQLRHGGSIARTRSGFPNSCDKSNYEHKASLSEMTAAPLAGGVQVWTVMEIAGGRFRGVHPSDGHTWFFRKGIKGNGLSGNDFLPVGW